MLGHGDGEEIGPVDVDGEEFPHGGDGVGERGHGLGEAGGCDEVVDFAVGGEDLGYGDGDPFFG